MPAPLQFRTPRLVLRPFAARDLDAFAAYRADPVVAAYQGWDAGYSHADAERLRVYALLGREHAR